MGVNLKIATTPWDWRATTDIESLCEQAVIAEDMGFHSFWVPENHFGKRHAVPAPLLLLAAAAARTSVIKLGCVSYLLPIRNALIAAEEVAVLDQLSGGRLILGLGRGIQGQVFGAFGIESAEKRRLFSEHLQLIRQAWKGEAIGHGADSDKTVLSPLPLQQPSPPLWAAAMGPKAIRQIAELGLPYLASPMEPLGKLKENYQKHKEFAVEAGLAPETTRPIMRTVFVTNSKQQEKTVNEAILAQVPARLRAQAEPVEDWAIVGSREFVIEQLSFYREELQLTHLILRAGIPGLGAKAQLESHQLLMANI